MTDDTERKLAIALARNDIATGEALEANAIKKFDSALRLLRDVQGDLREARNRLVDLLDGAPVDEAGKR